MRADTTEIRDPLPTRWRHRLVWGTVLCILPVRLAYYIFRDIADGDAGTVPYRLFEEATGFLTAVPLIWLAVRFEDRYQLLRRPWARAIAWSVLSLLVYSMLHTTAMLVVRQALGPLLSLGDYVPQQLASRYAYELANDVLPIGLLATELALAGHVFALAQRERRQHELERSLLETELRALRLQLQPHFLFNALNTISSTMYDDPAAADALLDHLSELLRTSLRTTHTHEVPIRDELALLDKYLRMMQARFGERLHVQVTADAGTQQALVPSMLLQPLVENAIRHGAVSTHGTGRVAVTISPVERAAGDRIVHIRVYDDGPGTPAGRDPFAHGTGLSSTRQRLSLLYGEAASMTACNGAAGGFSVDLRLPWRDALAAVQPDSTRAAQSVA